MCCTTKYLKFLSYSVFKHKQSLAVGWESTFYEIQKSKIKVGTTAGKVPHF